MHDILVCIYIHLSKNELKDDGTPSTDATVALGDNPFAALGSLQPLHAAEKEVLLSMHTSIHSFMHAPSIGFSLMMPTQT